MWAFASKIFENETLYSCLSRYVMTCPMPSSADVLNMMNISRHCEFTAHLPSWLPTISASCHTKPQILLSEHTTIKFFKPFIVTERFQQIISAATNGICDTRFTRLSQTVSAKEPLRFCPFCIQEQLATHGVSFWLVQHQYPGQFACLKHNSVLLEKTVNRREFCWPELPSEFESTGVINSLAVWIDRTHEMPQFQQVDFWETLKFGLVQHSLITPAGRIKADKLKVLMTAKWSQMPQVWIKQLLEDPNYPARLFYNQNHYHHPLKLILLVATIFEKWSDFLNCYEQILRKEISIVVAEQKPNHSPNPSFAKVISTAESIAGLSLRQLANKLQVSVTTAKNRQLQAGTEISCRPQFLFKPEVELIKKQLSEGFKTEDIARRFGCSKSAIEQILAQNPELKARRNQLRFQERQSHHRQVISQATNMPNVHRRVDIQNKYRTSYTWLYKHDREWLYDNIPQEIPRAQRVH